MPRIARIVLTDLPYHITQRGNYGQAVFDNDTHRLKYLIWLKEYSKRYRLKIWAYCLMTNHVHFIAVPESDNSLARTFNQTHMRYSQYLNRLKGHSGHLWQGRFFSCVLDERYLFEAVRYVERNPVRIGLVDRAEDYQWSSARIHVAGTADEIVALDCPVINQVEDWSKYLSIFEKEESLTRLRLNTHTGRPLGEDNFVTKIENKIERRLKALPRGRPIKQGE